MKNIDTYNFKNKKVIIRVDFNVPLNEQFEITDEKDFEFKNSDIIQENGSSKNTRILGTTNQLLRKINQSYPSLSCYSSNNKL